MVPLYLLYRVKQLLQTAAKSRIHCYAKFQTVDFTLCMMLSICAKHHILFIFFVLANTVYRLSYLDKVIHIS